MTPFSLRILETGSDAVWNWALIGLYDAADELMDMDRFEWMKQTKRPLLDEGTPDERHEVWEANLISIGDIAVDASRHFMTRQGISYHRAWAPSGVSTLYLQPSRQNPNLTNNARRLDALKNVIITVLDPQITVPLIKVMGPVGTVATVSNEYDTVGASDTFAMTDNPGSVLTIGKTSGPYWQAAMRFDVSLVEGSWETMSIKLQVESVTAVNADVFDVQGYDGGAGLTDPETDNDAPGGVRFTNCADDSASPFLDGVNDFNTAGTHTASLPAAAVTAGFAARDAGSGRFSIGMSEDPPDVSGGDSRRRFESLANAGIAEPRLIIGHTPPAFPPGGGGGGGVNLGSALRLYME